MAVTASTGVAATLLLAGRTAHSTFRIPIGVDASDTPQIKGHESAGERLRNTRVVILDEMTMLNKDAFEFIDKTLRSLYSGPEKNLPFAGKVVCMSGDWKQRLPIVQGGKRPDIVGNTIKQSELYHLFETLTLTENMRIAPGHQRFTNWCRDVGNGANYVEEGSELIRISEEFLIDQSNLEEQTSFVFPPHVLANPLDSEPPPA